MFKFRGEAFCSTDYVIIPQGTSGSNGEGTFDRFCGQALNDRVAADQPAASVPITSEELFILQGGNSQNFLHKVVRFFVTLGLKILRL